MKEHDSRDSRIKRVHRRLLQWNGSGASVPLVEEGRRRNEFEIAKQQLRLMFRKLLEDKIRITGA